MKTKPSRSRQWRIRCCWGTWRWGFRASNLCAWSFCCAFLWVRWGWRRLFLWFLAVWIFISTWLYHKASLLPAAKRLCKESYRTQTPQTASCSFCGPNYALFLFLLWDTIFPFLRCRLLPSKRPWLHSFFLTTTSRPDKQRRSYPFRSFSWVWTARGSLSGWVCLSEYLSRPVNLPSSSSWTPASPTLSRSKSKVVWADSRTWVQNQKARIFFVSESSQWGSSHGGEPGPRLPAVWWRKRRRGVCLGVGAAGFSRCAERAPSKRVLYDVN